MFLFLPCLQGSNCSEAYTGCQKRDSIIYALGVMVIHIESKKQATRLFWYKFAVYSRDTERVLMGFHYLSSDSSAKNL